ncbi:MAG: tRNA pseudouridine(38-40) synthase TruA [Chlorobi bacterium]|nr:tRNA pseudouridine(38-40) synthase TruA [Chlorobiota bacterium]
MARYFIEVAYKGFHYHGWQRQKNAVGIQNLIEDALSRVFKTEIQVKGASRTDAGAHAYQNFAHFDWDDEIPPKPIFRLNYLLPHDVVVKGLYRVPDEAHARFSALLRTYVYRVHLKRNPFLEELSYYYPIPGTLDISLMNRAATLLLNYNDYTAFARSDPQTYSMKCYITYARWFYNKARQQLVFIIEGNRFLRGMVRGLVGTMLRVGRGLMPIEEFEHVLRTGHKERVDFSPPGHGLYLKRLKYPFRFVWERWT